LKSDKKHGTDSKITEQQLHLELFGYEKNDLFFDYKFTGVTKVTQLGLRGWDEQRQQELKEMKKKKY
jgi:hypothetical protein